jgi:uncharacterized membrane protein YfcA
MAQGVWLYVWLGLSAVAAGAVNAIAGGGTLLTFPALLAVVPPVMANGTSTAALVPGSLSAAWGFRRQTRGLGRWLAWLTVPSLAGGVLGSVLVTCLDPRYFNALVPWLILTAALLFLFQPVLSRPTAHDDTGKVGGGAAAAAAAFQFLVAVYGGYFGAGIGILMLAALGLMGLGDIHAMNGLKNFLAVCINGVSVVVFALRGEVNWRYAAVMAPSAIAGAYVGSRLSQRIDRRVVRWIVIAIGFGLAAHYFYQRWAGKGDLGGTP